MQKIAIIGPGSIGIAAQMVLLAPNYDIISLADAPLHVDFTSPEIPEHYGPITMEHSFDGYYMPTPKEDAWLREQMELGERFEAKPVPYVVELGYESAAKEASWRAQQPRHCSVFTKYQPSTKSRKAARRRAKAGRKATR